MTRQRESVFFVSLLLHSLRFDLVLKDFIEAQFQVRVFAFDALQLAELVLLLCQLVLQLVDLRLHVFDLTDQRMAICFNFDGEYLVIFLDPLILRGDVLEVPQEL